MAKLIPLDEASQKLGISPEKLNDLRERQEIFGYRDGGSWKFKSEDVDQLAGRLLAGDVAEPDLSASDDSMSLDFDSDELVVPNEEAAPEPPRPGKDIESSDEMVLLSDAELAEGGSSSGTIIGRSGSPMSEDDSDVKLTSGEDRDRAAASGSATMIGKPGSPLRVDEEDVHVISAADARDEVASGSATIVGKPGTPLADDDSAIRLESSAELDLEDVRPTPPTAKPTKSAFEDDDEFSLESTDSGLALADEDAELAPAGPGGSAINLDEDDELVLGGSSGSDITVSPGDSGISLMDPADSGLSLEGPLELDLESSSEEEETFKLADSSSDEQVMDIEADFDSDEVVEVKSDDEFLLTPSAGAEEESDSGSQVIALDTDATFDESDAGIFAEDSSPATMLEDAESPVESDLSASDFEATSPMAAAGTMVVVRESALPVWVVSLLGVSFLFLALTGMMMFDVMRNMWSWDGAFSVNSSLMDMILGILG